jgi:hypothetical protein
MELEQKDCVEKPWIAQMEAVEVPLSPTYTVSGKVNKRK